MYTRFSPVCFFALATILGTAATAVAAELPAALEPPVALPAYTVTDSRGLPPPEAWRYAQIPGFEVLSNASDRETGKLLRDFQLFNQAIGVIWPALLNNSSGPVSLIICGRGGKFDDFVPKGTATGPMEAHSSLFFSTPEHSAIVVDFQTRDIVLAGLEAENASGVPNSGTMEVDPYKQLYREYVHALMARTSPRLPAWCEEGLVQLVMGMKFDRRSIEFAKLEDPNAVSVAQFLAASENAASEAAGEVATATAAAEDQDFNAALQRRALMPLQEMFAVAHDSPVARNPLHSSWAKQSAAFVHLCLYGENQRFQKGFLTFLLRGAKEPVTEALFQECFGLTYKKMLVELRGYIDFTNYKSIQMIAKKGGEIPEPAPLVLRAATEAQVGRIKGDAQEMAGRTDDARRTFLAAYARGERDPALLAALGLHEHAAGDDERAQKFLEAATAAGVVRPRAYLELARLRYSAAVAKPAGAAGKLSDAQTAGIATPLLVARSQPPALPEIYLLLADTLVLGAGSPPRETLQVLLDGVNLFPRRLGLAYQTAVLCARAGELKGAAALIELGLRTSPDDKTRTLFAELKASLPPLPAAAPAPLQKTKS